MCGIWAIVNRRHPLTPAQLASYEKIQPRGPDHSIIHLTKSTIFGFHRLAINELSQKGEQPFYLEEAEHRLTMMCNGEIYNHWQLREQYGLEIDSRSDCAVILPLFQLFKHDIKALNQALRGEYAFFIAKENLTNG